MTTTTPPAAPETQDTAETTGVTRRWAAPAAWVALVVALGTLTHFAAPVSAASQPQTAGAVLLPADPTPLNVVAALCGLLLLWIVPTVLVLAKTDLPGSRVTQVYLAYALVLLGQIVVMLLWNTIAHPWGWTARWNPPCSARCWSAPRHCSCCGAPPGSPARRPGGSAPGA